MNRFLGQWISSGGRVGFGNLGWESYVLSLFSLCSSCKKGNIRFLPKLIKTPTFYFLCLVLGSQENNLLPGLFEPGGYSLRNQAKGMLEVLRLAVCSEFDSRVSVRPSNIPF